MLADFDGAGRLDIAAAGARSLCSILINRGGGMFASSGGCTLPTTNNRIRLTTMLAPGDLTGGGKVDLAAIFTDFRAVSILANNGDGSFLLGADLPATAGSGLQGTLALADLDGDGKPEIVVGGVRAMCRRWRCFRTWAPAASGRPCFTPEPNRSRWAT
jgi:hypothetical protein